MIPFLICSYNLNAEDDFSSLLDEMTQIATKTKLNIDYQPSVVSVLRADKLKKIGINTLHEALGLLPGLETSILHVGWKQVIIRGKYSPDTYVFDKYKLYIDGVDIGSDLYSTSYYYLDFPVELIDRIEVLRGSASAVYGPGAFSGAINVITTASQSNGKNNAFLSLGSYSYIKSGFVQHYTMDNWNIGIDGYFQKSDKTIEAGEDFVVNKSDYKRTDYNSLEGFDDISIGTNIKNENYTFISRYKSEKTENFYGLDETLDSVEGGYQYNESLTLELQNRTDIDKDLTLQTKIGMNHYEFSFDATLYDDFDYRLRPSYIQLNSYFDISLDGRNLQDNNWMLGINLKKIDTLKNDLGNDYSFPSTKETFLKDDYDQIVKSVYFQDIYSFNDKIDISSNIRVDDYSIFGNMTSYRIGSVYGLDDKNILKAVYGRSYRAPSYIEAFQDEISYFKEGNANLLPEYIDTYELAYTHKNKSSVFRSNIYYSTISDVIDVIEHDPNISTSDYGNQKNDRESKGIELEYTYQFDNDIEIMTNFSYVQTEYFTTDYLNSVQYTSPEISEVLNKGYLLLPITGRLSFNTAWYYSGEKNGFTRTDGRVSEDLDSSLVIDETIVYDMETGSSIMFSLKNIFNESIKYPSYSHNNDYIEREGRNFLISYMHQL